MWKKAVQIALLFVVLIGTLPANAATAVSTSAMQVLLYVNQANSFVNGEQVQLDSPATVVEGKMYVPVKFLGDQFGFPVVFDGASGTIAMKAGASDVLIQLQDKTALIDGMPGPLEPTFRIINGRLMAQLTWMMDRIGAKYKYDPVLNRVEVVYLPMPNGLDNDDEATSRPVAKFAFGKSSYKMGELIHYIDLSYDVDGDGIQFVSWKNKEKAFFTPGVKQVSLQVTDSKGNVSSLYTREITIENEWLNTPIEFQMKYADPQSLIKLSRSDITTHFTSAEKLPVAVRAERGRTLLVSDSPENVTERGILYRDTVDGKARLYANHLNAMDRRLQFAIFATNDGEEPVKIETTRKGEVYPSIYANLIGYQASVDFLLGADKKRPVIVNPGDTAVYAMLPDFRPGQGINLIYDVETDGEVTFSFVAMIPNDPMEAIVTYPELPYVNHVRGTFPVSELIWNVDAGDANGASAITIGDNIRDVFVEGYDTFREQTVPNYGNYGVTYNIRVDRPGKSAVVLVPRGGPFKGPFKVGGELLLAPASGTITAYDGVFLLTRTDGTEPYIDIEFTPPAGSAFPVDLVFYPLE